MAANPIRLLTSNNVTLNQNSNTITLNDNANAAFVFSGSIIFINGMAIGEAIGGTAPVNNVSTITLRNAYTGTTITNGSLIANNTLEGLANAISRIEDAISSVSGIGSIAIDGRGLINKTGDNDYDTVSVTTFSVNLLGSDNTSEAVSNLGLADLSPINGSAGVLRKDALDNYSLITSTAFGESLLTQTDAAAVRNALNITLPSAYGANLIQQVDAVAARSVLGITDPTTFGASLIASNNAQSARTTLGITDPSTFGLTLVTANDAASVRSSLSIVTATETTEGLTRRQTQAEALAGTNNTGSMSAQRVRQSFEQFGLGASTIPPISQDLDLGRATGYYVALSPSTNKPPTGAVEGYWQTYQYDVVDYSLQKWVDFGSQLPRAFFRTETAGNCTAWFEYYTTTMFRHAQNVSGTTSNSNGTIAGSNLVPSQVGTWRNVSGGDILNNNYGLFLRI